MKYEMPVVTEDRRAELVNLLINRHAIMAPDVDTKRMEENMEIVLDIALAALTAPPVGSVGYAGGGKYEFLCIVWPAAGTKLYTAPPVPVLKQVDLSDIDHLLGYQQKWVYLPDVIKAISAAGYEVKE